MTRTEFIVKLCNLYDFNMSNSQVEKYKESMKNIDVENLGDILSMITDNGNSFFPKPIELESFNRKIKQSKGRAKNHFYDHSNDCSYCDGVGLIPFVTRYGINKDGQFRAGYGLACNCTLGTSFINSHGSYFDVFPEFEFNDWPRDDKYTVHFYNELGKMQEQWKIENIVDYSPL